jgi:general secretion pathway protein K
VDFPRDDGGAGAMTIVDARNAGATQLGGERGVALIAVLWIFIFLFVVAFEFSTAAREEASAAYRFHEETEGYYLALAGFERGLYDFLNQQSGAGSIAAAKTDLLDGAWREQQLGAGTYRVRFVDESGKINLNRANEATLQRVFTNLGMDAARRDVLVDAMLDWRDPDDLHRVNGAENEYYAALTPPYTAKNGAFDSVADLLWIKGMTSEIFYGEAPAAGRGSDQPRRVGLRDIFTVDSAIDRVNLRTASPEVIHALTGIALERCRTFVEERKKLSEKTLGDLLPLLGVGSGDPAMQMFIFTNPSVVSVEAEGRAQESGVRRRLHGVVRLGGARGFELMRWLDRAPALPSD